MMNERDNTSTAPMNYKNIFGENAWKMINANITEADIKTINTYTIHKPKKRRKLRVLRKSLDWEKLTDDRKLNIKTSRSYTPNGWILRTIYPTGVTMIYIPDFDHEWLD